MIMIIIENGVMIKLIKNAKSKYFSLPGQKRMGLLKKKKKKKKNLLIN